MNALEAYVSGITTRLGHQFKSGEIFAKILTPNDDSGRHGILIPNEAYALFPVLPIPNTAENVTAHFMGFDAIDTKPKTYAWKYYQRYPERRITRFNPSVNDVTHGRRLAIVVRTSNSQNEAVYYMDAAVEGVDGRFSQLLELLFGSSVPTSPGSYVLLPLDVSAFVPDDALNDLLSRFDRINALGWISTQRAGDTGLGYTFESLIGVEENNSREADFRGIELKCKLVRGVRTPTGKTNLFQQAPQWTDRITALARLREIGQQGADGLYSCFSQVAATVPNNLGLKLDVLPPDEKIDLRKNLREIGFWTYETLQARLREKHSRAAFVKAESRGTGAATKYHYKELVYCERPSIKRFVDLVKSRDIVFEFIMSEKAGGKVRNHGYPWRLGSQALLDQLFALQIKMR